MFRVVPACDGVPKDVGSQAALGITEQFTWRVLRTSAAVILTLMCFAGPVAFAAPPTPDQVARSILYDANGRPSPATFDAALKAKFPIGSSLAALAEFFRELGGFCARREGTVTYRCEADIDACSYTIIARVEATNDVIDRIRYVQLARKTCK